MVSAQTIHLRRGLQSMYDVIIISLSPQSGEIRSCLSIQGFDIFTTFESWDILHGVFAFPYQRERHSAC
jgi:hypothetical protein